MSRPIKFRAWVNEHWVDWLPNFKTLGEYNEVGIYADEYETDSKCFIEQYTGLQDKNGKEIYEGDIVKRVEDGGFNIVGVVEWSEKAARFWVKRYYYPNGNKWEVIGNIHENADLLGGEK